jgi:hypothetical protein
VRSHGRRWQQLLGHARARDGESVNALLKRLDKAIGLARSRDLFIDEVNDGESHLL